MRNRRWRLRFKSGSKQLECGLARGSAVGLDPGAFQSWRQKGLVAAHAALAGAAPARLVDGLAGAVAGVTGPLDGEETLLGPEAASALAGRAGLRLGAGLCAAAVADFAGH